MDADDLTRLLRTSVTTAVQLLEAQDGVLFPIALAVDASGRVRFAGAYHGGVAPHPLRALAAVRAALRGKGYRCSAVVYGIQTPNETGGHALCIELESLDAAPETILVPFVITRPLFRSARVMTYAPIRHPGRNRILGPQPSAIGTQRQESERTPPREKE